METMVVLQAKHIVIYNHVSYFQMMYNVIARSLVVPRVFIFVQCSWCHRMPSSILNIFATCNMIFAFPLGKGSPENRDSDALPFMGDTATVDGLRLSWRM